MIRRVRLLNPEVWIRPASRARSANLFSSELGLLPDLESRNHSYCSSHLQKCSRRARLSHPELGTRSAARTRIAKL
eukprot:5435911-Pyramimonas_sp.AAC.1